MPPEPNDPRKIKSRPPAGKVSGPAYAEAERRIAEARENGQKELDLEIPGLTKIPPLAGLTTLQSLNLMSTKVSDLSPLPGLTALQSLDLRSTQVSDLSPLAGLTALQSLNFTNTQVSDLSPLTGLNALQSLNLWDTQVSDLSPLAGLTALIEGARQSRYQGLSFANCPLTDPALLEFARLDNPERTVKTIEYLRERERLPRHVDPDEQLRSVSRALASGQRPSFGTEAERANREEAVRRLSQVEANVESLRNAPAPMGHNHPPGPISDDAAPAVVAEPVFSPAQLDALSHMASDLMAQLSRSEPDIARVMADARGLQSAARPKRRERWDDAKDEFAKGFSRAAGEELAKTLSWALRGAISLAFTALAMWLYSLFFM